MRVCEMIELLKDIPQDAEVLVRNFDMGGMTWSLASKPIYGKAATDRDGDWTVSPDGRGFPAVFIEEKT